MDGRTYLTYKTEKKVGGDWLTTTRLLRLDPANPDTTTIGASTQMTRWNSPSIEENPILIKRGDTYTLFTSRGWFKTCDDAYPYHTVYRQTKNLNNWPTEVKQLGFNAKISTCGKVNDAGDGRIFFIWNGHYPKSKKDTGPSVALHRQTGLDRRQAPRHLLHQALTDPARNGGVGQAAAPRPQSTQLHATLSTGVPPAASLLL